MNELDDLILAACITIIGSHCYQETVDENETRRKLRTLAKTALYIFGFFASFALKDLIIYFVF